MKRMRRVNSNFSVGFMLEDYSIKTDSAKREYLEITKGDLFEISVVMLPANEGARMLNVKELSRHTDPLLASCDRIQGLLKMMKDQAR